MPQKRTRLLSSQHVSKWTNFINVSKFLKLNPVHSFLLVPSPSADPTCPLSLIWRFMECAPLPPHHNFRPLALALRTISEYLTLSETHPQFEPNAYTRFQCLFALPKIFLLSLIPRTTISEYLTLPKTLPHLTPMPIHAFHRIPGLLGSNIFLPFSSSSSSS